MVLGEESSPPWKPHSFRPQSSRPTKEHLFWKPVVQHLSTAVLKTPVLADVLCRHPTDQLLSLQKTAGHLLATHMPQGSRGSKSSGKALQKDSGDRNYLLSTEPDSQCEEDPLQVSPVQVATPVGIKKHKSQKAVQGKHG